MASPLKIILFIACACLADCLPRGRFVKNPTILKHPRIEEVNTSSNVDRKDIAIKKNVADLGVPEVKTGYDADAIVFPSDNDKVYPDANKIVSDILITADSNKPRNDSNNRINNDETVPVPLLSIVVPPIEAKEVFTNPIVTTDVEGVTYKPLDEKCIDKENVQADPKQIQDTTENKTMIGNERNEIITLHDIEVENNSNSTLNSNETVPDFSSRFGVSNNYMLVPVNNVQSYQSIQPVPNGPVSNIQGNPPQSYLVNYDRSNTINPVVKNVGANPQYTMPNANVVSNIETNPQYIANADITPNMYATNANVIGTNNVNYNGHLALPQGNGNYVPINVPNTYIINGQLYAAVTVPNNVNVPNSLYFVNPQVSGYQVANNVPLYQLVSVNRVGNQVLNNAQVGTIN